MLVGEVLDWLLRGAGAGALIGAGYGLVRLRSSLRSSCDAATAAARLPPGAFAGKVVWVTGASSGIGRELARQLARLGARLILSARRAAVLEEVAAELRPSLAAGGEVRVLPLDLEDLGALPGKAREALSLFGGVDVLVNNGGYSSRALARESSGIEGEEKMMRVNFLSYVALTKVVLPSMLERKGGHIINISSLAGKMGVPLRTLYCGAKHALMGWFDALRAEEVGFFGSGIVVTNICPGSVKTDVAVNAVTADGSRRGYTDPNIEAGLDVAFVCDRILAAAHSGLEEAWIAPGRELQGAYLSQYLPATFKRMVRGKAKAIVEGTMGRDFVAARL